MSRLSLCMIVKNEEKYLAGCLDSVKGIADEIILVDTGSTDKTLAIAEQYNCKVYHFDWIDDFSAARNYSIAQASSDWILYLDADERLDNSSKDLVRTIIKKNKNYAIRCKIFNKDDIYKKPKIQSYTRLFKNSDKIKFTGRVHEQIDPSLEENNYKLIYSNILINHLGYNLEKSGLKQKALRNLNLLLEDFKENATGYNAYQIANSYNILGDKDKAFEYFELSLNDKDLPYEYLATSLNNIAEYFYRLGNSDKAADFIDRAYEKDPKNVLTNLIASDIYLSLDEGEKAVNYCLKAFNENEKKDKGNRLSSVLLEPEKIIYQGLYVAFLKNQVNALDFFFTKLQELKRNKIYEWEVESEIINMLSNNYLLKEKDISNIVSIINDNSYEFYFALLNIYQYKDIIVRIFENLVERYPQNTTYRNKYVLYLSLNGKNQQAISYLEEKFIQFPEDPTTIFYMIPLYLETKQFEKLEKVIIEGKAKFKQNKVFLTHINELEKKMNLNLINHQLN